MRLCIRSQDTGEATEAGLAARLDELGFDGVQLVAYKTFEDVKYSAGALSSERASQIGTALAGKDIALIGAYFNPVHSNIEKRKGCEQIFREYLGRASLLGGSTVGSETGSFNDDKWTYHPQNRTSEARVAVTKTFAGLCEYADSVGARVAIEGAAGHVCYSVDALNEVVTGIGSKNLDVIFDVYNMLEFDSAGDYLSIYKRARDTFEDRIKIFHLKDFALEGGNLVQKPVGQGMLNYREYLKLIKHDYPTAALVFEGTTGEHIAPAVQFIRRIYNEV